MAYDLRQPSDARSGPKVVPLAVPWHDGHTLGAGDKTAFSPCLPLPTETVESTLARNARYNRVKVEHLPSRFARRPLTGSDIWRVLAELSGIDSQQLLRKHSAAPYIEAFVSKVGERRWLKSDRFLMDGVYGRSLLSAGPRFCAECVAEDLDWYRFALWRRHHQIRGVDRCCKHGGLLLTSNVSPLRHLPSDRECIDDSRSMQWEGHDTALASAFGAIALDLLDRSAPVPIQQLILALQRMSVAQGLAVRDYTRNSNKREAGDLIFLRSPAEVRWIDRLAQDTSGTPPRDFIRNAIDGNSANTAALILAALLLCDSIDDAAALISDPTTDQKERIARIPRPKMLSAGNKLGASAGWMSGQREFLALELIASGRDLEEALRISGASRHCVTDFVTQCARSRIEQFLRSVGGPGSINHLTSS